MKSIKCSPHYIRRGYKRATASIGHSILVPPYDALSEYLDRRGDPVGLTGRLVDQLERLGQRARPEPGRGLTRADFPAQETAQRRSAGK